MSKGTTITVANIKELFDDAWKHTKKPKWRHIFIERRSFYEGPGCKLLFGFNPTKKQLDRAEKTDGYVGKKYNCRLLVSLKLKVR